MTTLLRCVSGIIHAVVVPSACSSVEDMLRKDYAIVVTITRLREVWKQSEDCDWQEVQGERVTLLQQTLSAENFDLGAVIKAINNL